MTNSEAIVDLQFLARRFEDLDQLTYSINRESLDLSILALEENDKLKAENERLKELMPKICETCEYEDEIGYEEPCNSCNNRRNWKLKSEE